MKTAESRPDKSFDLDLIYCRLGTPRIDYTEAAWKDLATILCNQDPNDVIFDTGLHRIFRYRRQGCKSAVFQTFWYKVAEGLRAQHAAGMCTPELLLKLCNLYSMGKSPTMKRHHRCVKFEMVLRELILLDVMEGMSGWLPSRLATYAQFLVSCSDSNTHTLPNYVVERIELMAPQFRANHIFQIAHGLETRHWNTDHR